MKVDKVVEALGTAPDASRLLDGYIAGLLGWRRVVSEENKVVWLTPQGVGGVVPAYTSSLDAAISLVDEFAPGRGWALVMENGNGRAVIDGGDRYTAATAAMAVCVAALNAIEAD